MAGGAQPPHARDPRRRIVGSRRGPAGQPQLGRPGLRGQYRQQWPRAADLRRPRHAFVGKRRPGPDRTADPGGDVRGIRPGAGLPLSRPPHRVRDLERGERAVRLGRSGAAGPLRRAAGRRIEGHTCHRPVGDGAGRWVRTEQEGRRRPCCPVPARSVRAGSREGLRRRRLPPLRPRLSGGARCGAGTAGAVAAGCDGQGRGRGEGHLGDRVRVPHHPRPRCGEGGGPGARRDPSTPRRITPTSPSS